MSSEDAPGEGHQATLDLDDFDESGVVTAPMRAIEIPLAKKPQRPAAPTPRASAPTLGDEPSDGPREGSKERPYGEPTGHPEIALAPEDAARIGPLIEARDKPNMAAVGLRVGLILVVLAGLAFGLSRLAG